MQACAKPTKVSKMIKAALQAKIHMLMNRRKDIPLFLYICLIMYILENWVWGLFKELEMEKRLIELDYLKGIWSY